MTTTTTTRTSTSLRTCLAIAGVCCFTVIQLYTLNDKTTKSRLLWLDCQSLNSPSGRNNDLHQQQQVVDEVNVTFPTALTLESFAISFDPTRVEKLKERNAHANLGNNTLWVAGTDGMHQRTLDLWAQLTNNLGGKMTLEQASQLTKGEYRSPHAVGVYLSHWNLLRTLAHRKSSSSPLAQVDKQQQQQQHAYLVLEDDATCAPGLKEEIARTIKELPSDWDLLFVGGKPFSYFFDDSNSENNNNTILAPTKKNTTLAGQLIHEYKQQETADKYQQIRHAICQGHYGKARGPLAPDGSRTLSQDQQAYWKVDYLTNTHSYVVNPRRVKHVARVLHPTANVPVDIRLGDLMQNGEINAYMTTRMWCDQRPDNELLAAPQTWQGFFAFPQYGWRYIWQTQMHLGDADCAF